MCILQNRTQCKWGTLEIEFRIDERFHTVKREAQNLKSRDLNYARYNLCGFVKDDVHDAKLHRCFCFVLFLCVYN